MKTREEAAQKFGEAGQAVYKAEIALEALRVEMDRARAKWYEACQREQQNRCVS